MDVKVVRNTREGLERRRRDVVARLDLDAEAFAREVQPRLDFLRHPGSSGRRCSVFGIDRTPNRLDDAQMSPQRYQDAVEALADAVKAVGLATQTVEEADRGTDIVILLPDGGALEASLKLASLVTADSAQGQLRRWAQGADGHAAMVVVADRITSEARDDLNRAGWNWLDLRGHLRLVGPGLFVDADVPAQVEPNGRTALSGRVGPELAALLLLNPTRRLGVRAAAAVLSRAPSTVSEAFAALRAEGLVDGDNRPEVPALFWELAAGWSPTSRDVASIPDPNRGRDNTALRLGLDSVESASGWALTDTRAAVAYGAPVSTRADHPPDFYVPDQSTLRRALQVLGPATTSSSRAGTIRVAPAPMVCTDRVDATTWTNEKWPLASPLFVALDLAQDPGRGREILEAWEPRKPWHRVW